MTTIAAKSTMNGNGVVCTVEELFFEGQRARHLDLHRLAKTTTITSGSKRSKVRGRGMEFYESRPYVPLDEMRTIDWKVSARLSKLHTKIFIEERERPIYFVVDLRPSMFFGSKRCFKSVIAAHIAAQLAVAATEGGDQICGLLFDKSLHGQGTLGHSKHHVARWFAALARGTSMLAERDKNHLYLNWPEVLSRLANKIRPGALVFLLSDFLDVDERIDPLLFRLGKKAQMYALAISDPLEEHMPSLGPVGMRFADERVVFDSDNANLKTSYESWWRLHQRANEDRFHSMGIPYLSFQTVSEPDAIVRSLLARGRQRAPGRSS